MTPLRTLAVVALLALLVVDLAAANAVIAADRTLLDADFVTETLEEEQAYREVESVAVESITVEDLAAGNDTPPLPVDPEAVAAAAIDPAYLQSQAEPNIERTYAYLHGRRDTLELTVDVEPVKVAVVEAVEAELVNASATELVETFGAGSGADLTYEASGVDLDLETVATMAENETVYDAERAELRTAIRERVLDSLVDEAFAQAGNDELLALVIEDYDPSAYTEAEKEQLVEERESEIRLALRDRIEARDDGEIAAAVDQQLAVLREDVRDQVNASVDQSFGDLDPALRDPTRQLVLVAVDGYLADTSHAAFSRDFEAAVDDLAVAGAGLLEDQLDEELPDRIDLTEELDPAAVESLETARQAVQLVDRLAVALPLVGLGLLGLIYLLTGSAVVTTIAAGIGLALGGLPALLGSTQVRPLLEGALADSGLPTGLDGFVLAIAGQVADAVLLQAAVVVGLGALLVVAGLGLHSQKAAGAPPEEPI